MVLLHVVFPGLSIRQVQAAFLKEQRGVSANDYQVDLIALYPEPRLEDPHGVSAYAKARPASERQRAALDGLLPWVSAN